MRVEDVKMLWRARAPKRLNEISGLGVILLDINIMLHFNLVLKQILKFLVIFPEKAFASELIGRASEWFRVKGIWSSCDAKQECSPHKIILLTT